MKMMLFILSRSKLLTLLLIISDTYSPLVIPTLAGLSWELIILLTQIISLTLSQINMKSCTLKDRKLNASPGPDGFNLEFYLAT